MLEFKSATKSKAKAKKVKFTIDGDEFTATKPKDSALALLVAAGSSDEAGEQMYEVLNLFRAMLSIEDMGRFLDKFRDPEDPFDLEDAMEVMSALIGEFSGRPTE